MKEKSGASSKTGTTSQRVSLFDRLRSKVDQYTKDHGRVKSPSGISGPPGLSKIQEEKDDNTIARVAACVAKTELEKARGRKKGSVSYVFNRSHFRFRVLINWRCILVMHIRRILVL